jgi:hypothetical protein
MDKSPSQSFKTAAVSTAGAYALVLIFLTGQAPVQARQTAPEAALEWEAESSRPAGYGGRALASPGARVTAAFLPGNVSADALKLEWFLDGAPVSTPDPSAIRFIVTRDPGVGHTVLARARNIKTQATEELTLVIPVVRPQVLIYGLGRSEWPGPRPIENMLSFPKGSSLTLLARSYFLPGAKPVFRWLKNGQPIIGAAKHPDLLLVNAPANAIEGSREYIQAMAQHPQFPGLTAAKEITVEIK